MRLVAILFVVVGHWMVAVVLDRDGEIVDAQLLALVPETQLMTWLFQVMPLFFFIGGYVNAGSWERAVARGDGWASWVGSRSGRLLRPLVPLIVLWTVLVLAGGALGVSDELLATAAETALLPVWFLVVYLGAIGLAPLTLALHRRAGIWVIVGALAGTAIIDALHLADVPAVGFVNYALVWAGIHQLGYWWHDGQLPMRPARHLWVAVAALALLVVLLALRIYPLSMVAVWGAERQNTDPPTLALWLFALAQIHAVLAARRPLERWMRRDRPYAIVVLGGSVLLTVFLWHMTAFIVVAVTAWLVPVWSLTATVDGTWWALRPLWLGASAIVLAAIVAVARRFEQASSSLPSLGRARTVLGLVAVITGLTLVLTEGLYDPDRAFGIPVGALAALAGGTVALGIVGPSRRR